MNFCNRYDFDDDDIQIPDGKQPLKDLEDKAKAQGLDSKSLGTVIFEVSEAQLNWRRRNSFCDTLELPEDLKSILLEVPFR